MFGFPAEMVIFGEESFFLVSFPIIGFFALDGKAFILYRNSFVKRYFRYAYSHKNPFFQKINSFLLKRDS